jgi:hypothetical protein
VTALGTRSSAATPPEIATLKQIAARAKSAKAVSQLTLAFISRIPDQE